MAQKFTERYARRLLGTEEGEETILWEVMPGTVIPIPKDTPREVRQKLRQEFGGLDAADRVGMASLLSKQAGTAQPPEVSRNPSIRKAIASKDVGHNIRGYVHLGANIATIAASLSPYGLLTRIGLVAIPAIAAGMSKKGGTLEDGWSRLKSEALFEAGAQILVGGLGVGPRTAIWGAKQLNKFTNATGNPVAVSNETMRKFAAEGGKQWVGGLAHQGSKLAAKFARIPKGDQQAYALASAQEHLRRIRPKSWSHYLDQAKRALPKNWSEKARKEFAETHLDTFRNLYVGDPVALGRTAGAVAKQVQRAEEAVEGSFPLWRMLTGGTGFEGGSVVSRTQTMAARGGVAPEEAAIKGGMAAQEAVIGEMRNEAGKLILSNKSAVKALRLKKGASELDALQALGKKSSKVQQAFLKKHHLDDLEFAEDIVSAGFGGKVRGYVTNEVGEATRLAQPLGARKETIRGAENELAKMGRGLRAAQRKVRFATQKRATLKKGKKKLKSAKAKTQAQQKINELNKRIQDGRLQAKKWKARETAYSKELKAFKAQSLTPIRTRYDYREAAEFGRKMGSKQQELWEKVQQRGGSRPDAPEDFEMAAARAIKERLLGTPTPGVTANVVEGAVPSVMKARAGDPTVPLVQADMPAIGPTEKGLLNEYVEDLARLAPGLETGAQAGRRTKFQRGIPGLRRWTSRVGDAHPEIMTGGEQATRRRYLPKAGTARGAKLRTPEGIKGELDRAQTLSERYKDLRRTMTLKRIVGSSPEEHFRAGGAGVRGGMGAASTAGIATLAGASPLATQRAMALGGLGGMAILSPTGIQGLGYGASRGAQLFNPFRRGLNIFGAAQEAMSGKRRLPYTVKPVKRRERGGFVPYRGR
jgi:hypothetical protein